MIRPSDDWADQIHANLKLSDMILLLVSADFIASNYCYSIELKTALERHEPGEARVIPITLRDVNWKGAPLCQAPGAADEWQGRNPQRRPRLRVAECQ
jgi:internalin A